MFQFQGIWLPDGEKHFPDWMSKNGELVDGRGTYQIKKLRAALAYCKQFRVAVDVGAHVGLWSMQLAKRFSELHAFEPVEEYRDCFLKNIEGALIAVFMHHCALGAQHDMVSMAIPKLGDGRDTGGTHVHGEGLIDMETLDSFGFQDVDFVKIDCEGYEHHVVEGAREMLSRCRPCVIVEQKPRKLLQNFGIKGEPAVALLRGLGAEVRAVMSGDYIMSWS